MTDLIAALLGQLQENTRRGAGCEVDQHPTPSTRGIGDSSENDGRRQEFTPDREWQARIELARRRLTDGCWTAGDAEIMRERTRVPWTLTNAVDCDPDCPHQGQPRHYQGVEIGSSVCDVDGTCWQAEREAHRQFRAEHGRGPSAADALFRRGRPALKTVEPVDELPIVKLAHGTIGQPPKMTAEQIETALAEVATGAISLREWARRDWQRFGFKNDRSAETALRRSRNLREQANTNHQEVAA